MTRPDATSRAGAQTVAPFSSTRSIAEARRKSFLLVQVAAELKREIEDLKNPALLPAEFRRQALAELAKAEAAATAVSTWLAPPNALASQK